jgi:hypothetical protein
MRTSVAGFGRPSPFWSATLLLLLLLLAAPAATQTVEQRGFFETRGELYPQPGQQDDTQAMAEVAFRYELAIDVARWLRTRGSFDATMDTYDQVERSWNVDFRDRTRLRPALAVRSVNATLGRGRVSLDLGKQFIRWGKADIVNPTDRFAPRDFLIVTDTELLAVTGLRLTVGGDSDAVEGVWVPWFTPSRIPLYDKRWTVLPPAAAGFDVVDAGATFPGGAQWGVRWNHLAEGYEFSISYFDGNNTSPIIDTAADPAGVPPVLALSQRFPRIRMAGGDLAWPLRWFTLKAEAGYFTAPDRDADEYLLYVIQLERQQGELSVVGGYAGEAVRVQRTVTDFAPDRGLSKAFLGRVAYTIDANRSLSAETAVRQDFTSVWLKGEYSQAVGGHWRATLAGVLIRGEPDDFIGQYRLNSHVTVTARYSF